MLQHLLQICYKVLQILEEKNLTKCCIIRTVNNRDHRWNEGEF